MSRVWIFREADAHEPGWLKLPGGPWQTAVLKPNWVRDYNERDPEDGSLLAHTITSPDVLLAVVSEIGPRSGRTIVADAPQFDADWERLMARLDIDGFRRRAAARGLDLDVLDLRQEVVRTDVNDVVLERQQKNGDPAGYRIVDLGERSAFARSSLDASRIRGADYDAEETIRHHSGGRHEYCVSGTILGADLVINVPKVKTHKKSGVTLSLKNLVGINGNKNFLPHHRAGRPEEGGDEFPSGGGSPYRRIRAWAVDRARPLLRYPALLSIIRPLRALDVRTRPPHLIRNGNWWGNDTIWRTILDLNRILLFADATGRIHEVPQRQTFHVLDGIAAGQGDGPMAPLRKDMGLLIASEDPVAADVATAALMGFDPFRIPVIRHACEPHSLPITRLGPNGEGLEIEFDGRTFHDWRQLPNVGFDPHPGWRGHIERTDPPANTKREVRASGI